MHRHDGTCGCQRSGGWPSNVRIVRTAVAAVEALTAGVMGAIDDAYSSSMQGRSGGAIRAGEGGDPSYRFSGYLAYQSELAVAPVGVSSTLRYSPDTLLPGTSGPVETASDTVMAHLAQLTPGGWRR